MGKPNKKQVWLNNLKADLREVFSLYDLQILEDDGLWFRISPYGDEWVFSVAPFSNHIPWDETRGAKKGADKKWPARSPDQEQPGNLGAEKPPSISCHAGRRCTNWPDCEFCGPPRI